MNILKRSIVASFSLIVLSSLMTSCVPEGLKQLPDEQRYPRIDRVLNDIDYKNIGEIISEEKDNSDGVFAPSYKRIGIKGESLFEEVSKRLSHTDLNEDCKHYKGRDSMSCSYNGARVNLYGSESGVVIEITDPSSGRN